MVNELSREDLITQVFRLANALRRIEKWSANTGTDLTGAGYIAWHKLIPDELRLSEPPTAQEFPPLPPDKAKGYNPNKQAVHYIRRATTWLMQGLGITFKLARSDNRLPEGQEAAKQVEWAAHGNTQCFENMHSKWDFKPDVMANQPLQTKGSISPSVIEITRGLDGDEALHVHSAIDACGAAMRLLIIATHLPCGNVGVSRNFDKAEKILRTVHEQITLARTADTRQSAD